MTTKPPLTTGQTIGRQYGTVVITLQHTRPGVYAILTTLGTKRVDTWSRSYSDEQQARDEATRAAHAFHAYRTVEGIERRRTELTEVIAEQSRRRGGMRDWDLLAASEAEYDALLTLADAAAIVDMRQHLTAALTAA